MMTIYDITFKMLQIAHNAFPWCCCTLMTAFLVKGFVKEPTLSKFLNEWLGIGLILVLLVFVMSIVFSQTMLTYTVTENTSELKKITQEMQMARRGI
jgi:uncharacterized membrane protein